jgi:hypothetical protein
MEEAWLLVRPRKNQPTKGKRGAPAGRRGGGAPLPQAQGANGARAAAPGPGPLLNESLRSSVRGNGASGRKRAKGRGRVGAGGEEGAGGRAALEIPSTAAPPAAGPSPAQAWLGDAAVSKPAVEAAPQAGAPTTAAAARCMRWPCAARGVHPLRAQWPPMPESVRDASLLRPSAARQVAAMWEGVRPASDSWSSYLPWSM